MIEKMLDNKQLHRYLVMAMVVVAIELAAFQVIYLILKNYYVATILSFIIAVILNWTIGRKFVFSTSHLTPTKEFSFVLVASIVGIFIQLAVVSVSIDVLLLYPFIGKCVSILFSFFWNYWFRIRYVYKKI
jgi:putative flippase GtrA